MFRDRRSGDDLASEATQGGNGIIMIKAVITKEMAIWSKIYSTCCFNNPLGRSL